MSTHALAVFVAFALLTGPVSAVAQQRPRIDVLTGEPVQPRSAHPRPEPEIFNAPHAPPQQHRADDPPIEIYAAPQMGTGNQQSQFSPTNAPGTLRTKQGPSFDPYATRRFPPHRSDDRRLDPFTR